MAVILFPIDIWAKCAVEDYISKPFFQMVGLQPDAFLKTLYCKCCYVSVYPFLIKMLSKTAGFYVYSYFSFNYGQLRFFRL